MTDRGTFLNPDIPDFWQVGLDVLKPSPQDLEHGLELHAQVPVVESYGLGLRAPCEPAAVRAAVEEGASAEEIVDQLLDMASTRWSGEPELREEFEEAWRASGVTCTFLNAGEEGNQPLRLIRRFAHHTYTTDALSGFMRRIAHPNDILAAHQAGEHAYCLTMNGVPLLGQQRSAPSELSMLRLFAQLGVRMMHLTYNRNNLLGGGCMEDQSAGLNDLGRGAVEEMNRCGVIIDLAHTGWQTCLDAALVSRQPVVVSHATAFALHEHPRAKPDHVIRAVLDTGGTIGLTNIPAFLGGAGDLAALLDHIDYVVKKFGSDAVSIGTDRAHLSRGCAQASAQLPPIPKRRGWESLQPTPNALAAPEWNQPRQSQSMAWTNWPLFTVGLVQRGHSGEVIRKIIGGNILRVARQVWEGSDLAARLARK